MNQLTVGILIFDDVEALDFCGPFEVFSVARLLGDDTRDESQAPFRAITIAQREGTVRCVGGLLVQPHYTLDNHPHLDILVVPGGWGTRREVVNDILLDWIAEQDRHTRLTTSVCTGAFLLAARGILDGKEATTHWASIIRLRDNHPAVTVRDDVRYVDTGRVITSAGISAGIDMALQVVSRVLGPEAASYTARRMEYEHWQGSRGVQA